MIHARLRAGSFLPERFASLFERCEFLMALPKKYIRLPVLLILLSMLFVMPYAGAQDDELIIDNPGAYRKKQRVGVNFPHDLHVGNFECLACHHDYKEGQNLLDEKMLEEGNPNLHCSACHNENTDINLKQAYHRQCIGCHREFRIHCCCKVCDKIIWLVGSAPGPELCGECHIK